MTSQSFTCAFCILIVIYVSNILCTQQNVYKMYDKLFKEGEEAYLEESWMDCVTLMLEALDDYKFYKSNLAECRLQCYKENEDLTAKENINDLEFWDKTVRNTLCLMKCKKSKFGDRPQYPIAREIEDAFEVKKPYDYLQLCYYKIDEPAQAASAAYTFLSQNPDHEAMRQNLKFYTAMDGVNPANLQNMEGKTYQALYIQGMEAYNQENYAAVVNYFEDSLDEYLRAEDECRVLCEEPFPHGIPHDFTLAIANHFAFVLRCKQRCADRLGQMYGEMHEDLLPNHYHYLQFSYYQTGELRKACEAAESYLLFFPDDATMKHNKEYYTAQEGVSQEYFTPREDAVTYFKRDQYEKEIMDFIMTNFKYNVSDETQIPGKSFIDDAGGDFLGHTANGMSQLWMCPASRRSLSSSPLEVIFPLI